MSISLARKLAICWSLAMAAPLVVPAQSLTPQGNETAVIGGVIGNQTAPCTAVGADGGFLVWQDNSVTSRGLRIRAVRLGSDLAAVGTPFTVSSAWKPKSTGDQEDPKVTLLQDGSGVVAWQGGKGGAQRIYIRMLDSDGSPHGSDLRVSTSPKFNQSNPCIATLADGSFIVVWTSEGQDGSMQGIYARRFSAAGQPLGSEFRVNVTTAYNQRSPALAALSDGGFVVAWISELQRGSGSVDAFARIYDSAGQAGNEFALNNYTNHICALPAIASGPSGFVIAWSEKAVESISRPSNLSDPTGINSQVNNPNAVMFPANPSPSNVWDVVGQFFDDSHAAVAGPKVLNTYVYGSQYAPQLCVAGQGYAAVWTSWYQDGAQEGVFGQLLSSEGEFEGSEFQVNTTWVNRQYQPTVAFDGTGRILTVWSGFVARTGTDLFSQIYSLTP